MTCSGFGIQTPRRTFATAMRNRYGRFVILPIEGDTAAPDMATAAGTVTSCRRADSPARSTRLAESMPTNGPPHPLRLKVKLVTDRPGGEIPGSDRLAAAQTTSSGEVADRPEN